MTTGYGQNGWGTGPWGDPLSGYLLGSVVVSGRLNARGVSMIPALRPARVTMTPALTMESVSALCSLTMTAIGAASYQLESITCI
jgi:hypothetical protein